MESMRRRNVEFYGISQNMQVNAHLSMLDESTKSEFLMSFKGSRTMCQRTIGQ